MSSIVPARTTVPRSSTTICWHSRSTSPSRCVHRITLLPVSAIRSSSSCSIADPPGRVQAVGRFVEQQQLRIVHQRRGQLQPLQVAGGVFFQPPIAQLAQADVVEHLVGSASGVAMRHAVQIAGEGHELDALEHRHDGRSSRACSPPGPRSSARAAANIAAQDRAAAGVGREQSQQHLEQRRFSGAVVAHQADRAGLEREVHVDAAPCTLPKLRLT